MEHYKGPTLYRCLA